MSLRNFGKNVFNGYDVTCLRMSPSLGWDCKKIDSAFEQRYGEYTDLVRELLKNNDLKFFLQSKRLGNYKRLLALAESESNLMAIKKEDFGHYAEQGLTSEMVDDIWTKLHGALHCPPPACPMELTRVGSDALHTDAADDDADFEPCVTAGTSSVDCNFNNGANNDGDTPKSALKKRMDIQEPFSGAPAPNGSSSKSESGQKKQRVSDDVLSVDQSEHNGLLRVVIGVEYEGENNCAPFYNGLIQQVKIKKVGGGWYQGEILGLAGGASWRRSQLHPIRLNEPPRAWTNGDAVQFQITETRYGINCGEKFPIEDGEQIGKGHLWCKGKITAINEDMFTIEHSAWNAQDPDATKTTIVHKDLIRSPYSSDIPGATTM